jgi:hypothetical protein
MMKFILTLLVFFSIAISFRIQAETFSPDWDTVIEAAQPFANAAVAARLERPYKVTGEDHAQYAKLDSEMSFGEEEILTRPKNDGYQSGPFEVGWVVAGNYNWPDWPIPPPPVG